MRADVFYDESVEIYKKKSEVSERGESLIVLVAEERRRNLQTAGNVHGDQ